MNEWWPKLRSGGLFAGHDYAAINFDTRCEDGQMGLGAIKRAVDEFAREHDLTVMISHAEHSRNILPSWFMRKP